MDSLKPLMRRQWPLFTVAALFGLYGWALVAATGSGHDGVIGPHFNALGADWVIFLAAARAFFTGDLAHIYQQLWITDATNSQFADWLSSPLPFPLFPYPPVFLLLVLPFAKLPVAWSLLLSQAAQFAALAWALRRLAPDKSYLFFLIAALLCPSASNNVLAGSNAVLVTALIVGGFALIDSTPFLAGALLGVVIFKPQFFPLLPLALMALQQSRALAGMILSAVLLVLASVTLFGSGLWQDWINVYLHPQVVAGVNGTDWGHSWDESVSTCVTLLGAPHWLATVAQMLMGAIAILDRDRPHVLLEIHPVMLQARFGSSGDAVLDLFRDRGYRMFALADGRLEERTTLVEGLPWKDYFFIHPTRAAKLPDGVFKARMAA